MNDAKLREVLITLANRYPDELIRDQVRDVVRIHSNIQLVLHGLAKPPETIEICDLGGGIGLFSVGCAAYGMKRTVLVDDFEDPINHAVGSTILDLHRGYGVDVVSRDVIRSGLKDLEGRFDIITSFDSMEHWHHSPKQLFCEVVEKLKPGGIFCLGVPNCVNLRKRLTVPLGFGKWSSMQDWYETKVFRGHVREADVSDLRYIVRDMGLAEVRLVGRNWLGYFSGNGLIRVTARLFDYPLRFRPQLCSDIYVLGRKPL
ncbi:class I SAM-dependent methyltransferase [uncultured Thiodictyon sp.]|uniref:class I SAM-dependent methyltransferase n=1 Tax=uncultured Thiodictyon sp. TaxID=1846217 RepID=UPI0025F74666|nr:class I SAM-dependent methyltransferase [uncultured Thiodictyon sp.]